MAGKKAVTKPFKPKILAKQAKFGKGMFDSELEKPSGINMKQNAWLTLRLKIKLNFVDKKNPLAGKTKTVGGKYCAKDWNDYWFPILDWDETARADFRKRFLEYEKVWNWQFVLITPKDYDGLDVTNFEGVGWVIRPNVLCLFRLEVVPEGGHETINVYRLDKTATKATKPGKPDKDLTAFYPSTSPFRSDAGNYVDMDIFDYNTIAHELGHSLAQDHILGLKDRMKVAGGDATCRNGAAGQGASKCYGTTTEDKENVMGSGRRIYLINAISWLMRIAEHTGTPHTAWQPTGVMSTPPRKITMPDAVLMNGTRKF